MCQLSDDQHIIQWWKGVWTKTTNVKKIVLTSGCHNNKHWTTQKWLCKRTDPRTLQKTLSHYLHLIKNKVIKHINSNIDNMNVRDFDIILGKFIFTTFYHLQASLKCTVRPSRASPLCLLQSKLCTECKEAGLMYGKAKRPDEATMSPVAMSPHNFLQPHEPPESIYPNQIPFLFSHNGKYSFLN